MKIEPIRNRRNYDKALARIDRLWNAKPGTKDYDELELLSILVEHYEAKHYPMPPPDPIEAIRFRMEQMDLDRKDLEPYIGSRARVSEVLGRRRPLSIGMVRKLRDGLGISADILVNTSKARVRKAS